MPEIDSILVRAVHAGASDVHFQSGERPRWRVNGLLETPENTQLLTSEGLECAVGEVLSPQQKRRLESESEVTFSHTVDGGARFRASLFRGPTGAGAVFHRVPAQIPTLAELHLERAMAPLLEVESGLVLVTGPSGSGKTCTLAALLDRINFESRRHVITLEDPIEFWHPNKHSIVHQRELHRDFSDFPSGIEAALGEDPDVILVGELRDAATARPALAAAEAGVLVLSTLRAQSAAGAVECLLGLFPPAEQPLALAMLAQGLAGVVTQYLLRQVDHDGFLPATEVLLVSQAVANLLREGRTQDLPSLIQGARSIGMHTLDDSMERLVVSRHVDPEDAYTFARQKARFEGPLAASARA
jgi:twitching motility protein PilT